MGSLSKTLKTQVLDVFGLSPSNRWSSFSFGVGTWGIKSAGVGGKRETQWTIIKRWSGTNQIAATMAHVSRQVNFFRTTGGSISVVFAYTDKELGTGNGYDYQFIDRVSNIESAAAASIYASQVAASVNYTSQAAQTTIWS